MRRNFFRARQDRAEARAVDLVANIGHARAVELHATFIDRPLGIAAPWRHADGAGNALEYPLAQTIHFYQLTAFRINLPGSAQVVERENAITLPAEAGRIA